MECFRLLFDHLAWIEHQSLRGIRDLKKAGSLWGMMRDVWGVRMSIHQSWLAKGLGLGLGLLCWGFKRLQEEIPREEASTLQIGVSDISTRTMHQFTTPSLSQTIWPDGHHHSSSPSYKTKPYSRWFWLFPKLTGWSLWDNWGDERGCDEGHRTLTQENLHGPFQKLLQRRNKCNAAGRDYFEGD